jgi:hypothetical protein
MNLLDVSAIKAFGQIAGIGGLSLFVFVYLFREVIRKKIFPELSRDQAYKTIRLFMVLIFLLSISGLAAWVYVQIHAKPIIDPTDIRHQAETVNTVESAVTEWLKLIDAADYSEAWQSIPKEFPHPSETEFSASFKNALGAKGKVTSRNLKGTQNLSSPPGFPSGEYESRSFQTQFENGAAVTEFVTAIATPEGWRVVYHQLFP